LEKDGIARWLSMGRLLREKLSNESRKEQKDGDLIDDKITTGILAEALGGIDNSKLVVLDGFPRRDSQSEWLFSDKNPRRVDGVIYIDLPEEVAIERLRLRHREDDNEVVIKHRYEIFHRENGPILSHFKNRGIAIEKVDGDDSIEVVHQRIVAAVNKLSGYRANAN
jgi:adenylate kinase